MLAWLSPTSGIIASTIVLSTDLVNARPQRNVLGDDRACEVHRERRPQLESETRPRGVVPSPVPLQPAFDLGTSQWQREHSPSWSERCHRSILPQVVGQRTPAMMCLMPSSWHVVPNTVVPPFLE